MHIPHVSKHSLLGGKGLVTFLALYLQPSLIWFMISSHVTLQLILGEKGNMTLVALQPAGLNLVLFFHVLLKCFPAVECVCAHLTFISRGVQVVHKHMIDHLERRQSYEKFPKFRSFTFLTASPLASPGN